MREHPDPTHLQNSRYNWGASLSWPPIPLRLGLRSIADQRRSPVPPPRRQTSGQPTMSAARSILARSSGQSKRWVSLQGAVIKAFVQCIAPTHHQKPPLVGRPDCAMVRARLVPRRPMQQVGNGPFFQIRSSRQAETRPPRSFHRSPDLSHQG